jgi:hypothetical protein
MSARTKIHHRRKSGTQVRQRRPRGWSTYPKVDVSVDKARKYRETTQIDRAICQIGSVRCRRQHVGDAATSHQNDRRGRILTAARIEDPVGSDRVSRARLLSSNQSDARTGNDHRNERGSLHGKSHSFEELL